MKSQCRLALCASSIIALAGFFPLAAETDPLFVNLNDFPLFVKTGFAQNAINEDPTGLPGWKMLPPAGNSGRGARPMDIKLEGLPKRMPFSLKRHAEMEFTYAIPFEFPPRAMEVLAHNDGSAAISRVPGIHLAALGDNWEIFLNGTRIRSELHLDADGRILGHRSIRDIRFPVHASLFRAGRNLLVIRVIADPTYPPAGLHQADPYFIASYESIERKNNELFPVVLCGLYLFIGLYHIFMFFVRPVDRHNLYYGLFSIDLAIYLFVRTHTAYTFIPDSDLVFRIELASLSFILPLVGAFIETLNDDKVLKRTRAYAAFSAILAILEVSMPTPFAHDLLRLWQFSGIGAALYYFGWDILGRFLRDGYRRWKRKPLLEGRHSLGHEYFESLTRTPLGNLLIGSLILFLTAIFDIIDAVYMQWDLVLTQYGFFLFTMGTALILANRFGFLHERLRGLNIDLEDRMKRLTVAGDNLAASERKYKSLFHGSTDPLALLDEKLVFVEGNRAAVELFDLDRPSRENWSLDKALYIEEREGRIQAERLRRAAAAQLRGAVAEELSVKLRTMLGEPKPCRIRLERIASEGKAQILLRVLPQAKDELADYFVEGRERYDIENTLSAAEDACQKACARLTRYIPEEDAGFLEICLREIVVNAIEHGNLEIGFDDKTENQRSGRYFDFLLKRRLEPSCRDRRVVLEYSISPTRATFRVTDAGKGFDHRALLESRAEPSPEMLEHGRGLVMTLGAFDKVIYNEKGNQATLVKFFRKPEEVS